MNAQSMGVETPESRVWKISQLRGLATSEVSEFKFASLDYVITNLFPPFSPFNNYTKSSAETPSGCLANQPDWNGKSSLEDAKE
jgi:hypothetical protein